MQELVDKVILFICCFSFLSTMATRDTAVVVVILTIFLSSLITFFHRKFFTNASACLFGAVAFFLPEACLFLPVLGYDVFRYNKWAYILGYALPLLKNRSTLLFAEQTTILLFLLLAYLLEYRTRQLKSLENRYFTSRDENMELLMRLEAKNNELMDKQDYEVHLATLKERNRIAREIHDNVGHSLSRALLQIGALIATQKETVLTKRLTELKDTLSGAMTNIRESVHDLHTDSIDLYETIREILHGFKSYNVDFDYDVGENVPQNIKYCILCILRESLTNITKHSDATNVRITLKEHPALYQLMVHDNGNMGEADFENGIGLKNMETRVHALQGVFHVTVGNGFQIFVTIPKENTANHGRMEKP